MKILNCQMAKTSLKRIFNNYVWETVMSLGEPDSEIFVRWYKFDEKIKDISKAMGLNISTVEQICIMYII